MPEFSYRVREKDQLSVVEVAGDVDMSVAGQLGEALEQLVPVGDVVLDCTAVTFFDSMGLRVAVNALNKAAQAGTAFSLVPSHAVARVLELAGVTSIFVIHDSVPTSA